MGDFVGTHPVSAEKDIFFFQLVGLFTFADAREIYARSTAFAQRHGYSLVLTDLTRSSGITAEARRFVAERLRQEDQTTVRDLTGSANFGASLPVRAATTMYYAAMRVLTGNQPPMVIVKTEAEARKWLDLRRTSIFKKLGRTPAVERL